MLQGSSVARLYQLGTSSFVLVGIDGKVKYVSQGYKEAELQTQLDTLTDTPGETPKIIPKSFKLYQNYPNPFNPTTKIEYEMIIENEKPVKLVIYDLLGKKVATLIREKQKSGFYQITWNGRSDAGIPLPAGIYIYRLTVGNRIETKRMILLR